MKTPIERIYDYVKAKQEEVIKYDFSKRIDESEDCEHYVDIYQAYPVLWELTNDSQISRLHIALFVSYRPCSIESQTGHRKGEQV